MSNPGPKSTKSITEKLAEINEKIDWFYGEDFSLDQAAAHYKEAVTLAKAAEKDLRELKNEIEVIGQDFSKN